MPAVLRVFPLPPTLSPLGSFRGAQLGEELFKKALGELGYPGFAHALDSDDLDSRVRGGLAMASVPFPRYELGLANRRSQVEGSTKPARIRHAPGQRSCTGA